MPLSAEIKAETLVRDFGGQAKLAAVLGVERSTVSRWVHGSTPDPTHAARVDALEFVLAEAQRIFGRAGARKWFQGLDPHLGDRGERSLREVHRSVEIGVVVPPCALQLARDPEWMSTSCGRRGGIPGKDPPEAAQP